MTETPTPPPAEPTEPAGDVAAPRGSSRRGVVIGSVAAVLAVLAGAAVYATTALSGGGRQPDELVPKAAFAYLKIDLDPAAGQKLAARSFFSKFPDLGGGGNDDEHVFDSVLTQALSDEDIDFATDIKPWFDKRAAVAAFPGSGGAKVVAVLRSKDDGKARAALDKAAERARTAGHDVAYTITKGYVVLGEDRAAVDEAVKLSGESSLRDNTVYRKDVDELTGDQVAVSWVDLQPAFRAGKDMIPFADFLPGAVTDQVKGRLVAGVHFSGDYVEAEGLALGIDQRAVPKATEPALLRDLPASTVAAVSVNGLGDTVRTQLAQLGGSGLSIDDLLGGFLGGAGVSLEDDLLPLLGDQTVLALGSAFRGFGSLDGALLSHVANAAKAREDGEKLAALVSGFGVPVRSLVKDDTLVLATPGYAVRIGKGQGLGATPKFTKAMGDISSVSGAAYVDVEAMLAGRTTDPRAKPLRSFGAVAGTRDGTQFFRLRLVAE
jgi:hypothetical protein